MKIKTSLHFTKSGLHPPAKTKTKTKTCLRFTDIDKTQFAFGTITNTKIVEDLSRAKN